MTWIFPVLSLIICVAVYFFVGRAAEEFCARLISESRDRKEKVAVLFSVLEFLAIGGCIEAADISEAFKNGPDGEATVCLVVLWPLVLTFVIGQRALWLNDSNTEVALQTSKTELRVSQATTDFLVSVLDAISAAIKVKTEGIRRASDLQQGTPLPSVLATLGVSGEAKAFALTTFNVFQTIALRQPNGTEPAIVRSTVFSREGDRLKPVYRYVSGQGETSVSKLASMKKDANIFALSNVRDCLVVTAAYGDDPVFEPDTVAANADDDRSFHFLYRNQKEIVKSIVCIPLRTQHCGKVAKVVISLDSNISNFFSVDRQVTLKVMSDTLKSRFGYAMAMDDLLKSLAVWVEKQKVV